MSKRCNKCGQGDPHLSDTWCLACTAVEAVTGELRLAWGTGGTRALATDLLVSATRQVRALRRLGIAGGGRSRPASPARAVLPAAAGEGAGRAATPAPEPPPPPPHPKAAVKEEDADSSEYTEDTGEPSEEKERRLPGAQPGVTLAPKAKSDRRESLPRRRASDQSSVKREADQSRAPSDDQRSAEEEADYGRAPSKEQHLPPPEEEQARPRSSGNRRASDRETHPEESVDRDPNRTRGEADKSRAHSREGYHQHRPHSGEGRRCRRSRSRRGGHRRVYENEPGGEPKKKKKKNKHRQHRAGSKHQQYHKAAEDPFRRFHYRPPDSFWDRAPSPP